MKTPMVGCVVIIALSWCGLAAAQTTAKDEAKRHFDAGLALVEAEDYAGAAAEFETSIGLFPTKMGLFNLANAYKALHRYADALAVIGRLERELGATLEEDLGKEVTAFKQAVQEFVGNLDVRVDKDGAAVRVDGREVGRSPLPGPLVVGPGEHVVEVSLEGFKSVRLALKAASGETSVAEIALVAEGQEEGATKPMPKRVWTWVAFGVGGAAAIASAITGGIYVGKSDDVKSQCDGNDCPTSVKDDADATRTLGNATTALIVVAGVGVAAGVALYFLEPKWGKNESAVEIAPVATAAPDGAAFGIAGRF